MEKTKFFLCLLLSLYSISSTQINLAAFPEEDGIMVLTDETFEEAENTYDFLFVHFFAPWCGICEMSLKDLAKELPEIKKEVSNVGFAKIDGTYYRKFYNKYDANGFPTVFLVAKGQKISEYNGAKKANLIIEWLNERILPTVVPIDSVEMFNKYVKKSENKPLLAYFGYNFDEFTSFDKLANNYLKDFTFINIRDKALLDKIKAKDRQVKMYKSFDEKMVELQGSITYDSLVSFIEKYGHPIVMKYNFKAKQYIFDENHSGLLFLTNNSTSMDQIIEKVSQNTRNLIQTLVLKVEDSSSKYFQKLIQIKDIPSVVIFDVRVHPKMYVLNKEIINNADKIIAYIKDWSNNKAPKQYHKIPSELKGNVLKVTERTFDKEVINNDLDVFVKFYAPWCGHCKHLAPIYEQLAEKLNNNDKLQIVEIDATMNTVPGIQITGYPTLIFFKNGQKEKPIIYNGEHNLSEMTSFIKENASRKIIDK